MGLKDKYDFSILVNETEEVVMEELEKQLNKEEYQTVCRCEECIMDMMALALNQLQPSYRSSFTGVIYAQKLHLLAALVLCPLSFSQPPLFQGNLSQSIL